MDGGRAHRQTDKIIVRFKESCGFYAQTFYFPFILSSFIWVIFFPLHYSIYNGNFCKTGDKRKKTKENVLFVCHLG